MQASKAGGVWYVRHDDLLDWDRQTKRPVSTRSPAWERTEGLVAKYGSVSPEELAELAGIHVGNARKHLAILAKQGRAERLADGQWVLTGTGSERQGVA